MIQLKEIVKTYVTGDTSLDALKKISINFRQSEFVSILGASGCGKTTMLNIIGGLDRYTSGDLVIDGTSTKQYKDNNWDTYRNHKVGFVFQSYNLIAHLSVLANVELALTLSGISKTERRERAKNALAEVGLSAQIKKKPNQLSGGQMQRVAIARALVNNPSIILADEPTGALDSETSVQVMDILKKISQNRLIVMVTHNAEIAKEYSSRVIEMKDGEVIDDSNAFEDIDAEMENQKISKANCAMQGKEEQISKLEQNQSNLQNPKNTKPQKACKKKKVKKQSSMGYLTALTLSGLNLLSKKAKTFMTAFAGSIGIIGIALVLAISNGFSAYITQMQTDILAGYPISVETFTMDLSSYTLSAENKDKPKDFNDDKYITVDTSTSSLPVSFTQHYNYLSPEFVAYMQEYRQDEANSKNFNDVYFSYASNLNTVAVYDGDVKDFVKEDLFFEGVDNLNFVESQYDVYGTLPKAYNEVALVIPTNNYIDKDVMADLGIDFTQNTDGATTVNFDDIIDKLSYSVIINDNYYNIGGGTLSKEDNAQNAYLKSGNINLDVTAVLRVKEQVNMNIFNTGIMYTTLLTQYANNINKASSVATMQRASNVLFKPYKIELSTGVFDYTAITCNSITEIVVAVKTLFNKTITPEIAQEIVLQKYGASSIPSKMILYPTDFNGKTDVLNYIEEWNAHNKDNQILYTDTTALFTQNMTTMVDVISYVLIAFASVSLFVSSIMIGVLTYASVLERRKEIGILRSIGARKKDVSRVFNSETFIIGISAGLLGVIITYLLCPVINSIVIAVAGGVFASSIAVLNPLHALALVLISCILTLVAGLIPARVASKNDPVKALRSE